jgi:hypothetical protein
MDWNPNDHDGLSINSMNQLSNNDSAASDEFAHMSASNYDGNLNLNLNQLSQLIGNELSDNIELIANSTGNNNNNNNNSTTSDNNHNNNADSGNNSNMTSRNSSGTNESNNIQNNNLSKLNFDNLRFPNYEMRRIVSEVTNSFTTVFSLYHYLDKPTWLG